jgi:hypothetical protein
MARKTDYEPDSDRDLEHEVRVARCLAVAFIAQSHRIGMDYASKEFAHVPAGSLWIDIARQVLAQMAQRGGKPDFSATIQ